MAYLSSGFFFFFLRIDNAGAAFCILLWDNSQIKSQLHHTLFFLVETACFCCTFIVFSILRNLCCILCFCAVRTVFEWVMVSSFSSQSAQSIKGHGPNGPAQKPQELMREWSRAHFLSHFVSARIGISVEWNLYFSPESFSASFKNIHPFVPKTSVMLITWLKPQFGSFYKHIGYIIIG